MSGLPEITAAEAIARAEAGTARLVDVREQDEWDRGHSPLATLVPMSQLQARLGEIPDDEPLLIVCHAGVRSARVTQALVRAGYDASNVAGGMTAWVAAGGPLDAQAGREPRID